MVSSKKDKLEIYNSIYNLLLNDKHNDIASLIKKKYPFCYKENVTTDRVFKILTKNQPEVPTDGEDNKKVNKNVEKIKTPVIKDSSAENQSIGLTKTPVNKKNIPKKIVTNSKDSLKMVQKNAVNNKKPISNIKEDSDTSSDSTSEEEKLVETIIKTPTNTSIKINQVTPVNKKKDSSSDTSSDSSSEEEKIVKTINKTPIKNSIKSYQVTPVNKKKDSSSDTSSDSLTEEEKKKTKPAYNIPAKSTLKINSGTLTKNKQFTPKKTYETDSSSDSSSDEEQKKSKTSINITTKSPLKINPSKKIVSTSDTSSDSTSEEVTKISKQDINILKKSPSNVNTGVFGKNKKFIPKNKDDTDSSSSEDEKETGSTVKTPLKVIAKNPVNIAKVSKNYTADSDSSSDEDKEQEVSVLKEPIDSVDKSVTNDEESIKLDIVKRHKEFDKGNKNFKRVKTDPSELSAEFSNNKFIPKNKDDYGYKASKSFSHVKGKQFNHEKTKKKRGSYSGGKINTSVNSIKF